jgi:hypothetical protein
MKEKFVASHAGGGSHGGRGDHNNYIRRGNGYNRIYTNWDNDWVYPLYVINPVVVNPCPTDYILYNNFTYYNNNVLYTLNNVCASADFKNDKDECKNNGVLVSIDNSSDKKYKCMINH